MLAHWKSSLFGVLAGTFGGLAAYANVDSMSGKEFALAIAACLMVALKGLVSADASKTLSPPPPPTLPLS
jgi:hypothetical protein